MVKECLEKAHGSEREQGARTCEEPVQDLPTPKEPVDNCSAGQWFDCLLLKELEPDRAKSATSDSRVQEL